MLFENTDQTQCKHCGAGLPAPQMRHYMDYENKTHGPFCESCYALLKLTHPMLENKDDRRTLIE